MIRRLPVIGPISVRAELVRRYRDAFGQPPDIASPQGFNEHIVRRILLDRDPRLRIVCDKLAVRDFICRHAGAEFVIPLLGVWKDPRAIAWEALPERFVLKPNHASGPVAIVRSAGERDLAALSAAAARWLTLDYYDQTYEWGYRGIPRRLLAEPLLVGPDGGQAPEIQILCFHGSARIIRVHTGAKLTSSRRDNWFDINGTRLDISIDSPQGDYILSRADLDRLLPVAQRIAAGFSHLRVDFYLTDAGPKIGELTPYHAAGRSPWNPAIWDRTLGAFWAEGAAAG